MIQAFTFTFHSQVKDPPLKTFQQAKAKFLAWHRNRILDCGQILKFCLTFFWHWTQTTIDCMVKILANFLLRHSWIHFSYPQSRILSPLGMCIAQVWFGAHGLPHNFLKVTTLQWISWYVYLFWLYSVLEFLKFFTFIPMRMALWLFCLFYSHPMAYASLNECPLCQSLSPAPSSLPISSRIMSDKITAVDQVAAVARGNTVAIHTNI